MPAVELQLSPREVPRTAHPNGRVCARDGGRVFVDMLMGKQSLCVVAVHEV